MIPHEALDVAVDALVASRLGDHKGINGEEFVEAARAALEAAEPYMRNGALARVEAVAKELDERAAYRSGTPAMKSAIAALIRNALTPNPYGSQRDPSWADHLIDEMD